MSEISVCLIVKDEELVLKRCLNCVKEFADEIVVVDTGSTDKTIDIAKKYTNKVFNYHWQQNFSLARNFAFSKASKDYVMWIDADDVIDNENIRKLKRLKEKLSADTYMLKYEIAFDESGKPTFEYYRERILKNCEKAKFNGFVHEAITPFGKIEYVDISLKHKKEKVNKDKRRNLNLYRYHKRIGAKFSAREMFYYARELYYNGYYSATAVALKKFLKMGSNFLPNIIDAHITLSDCYLIKNNTKNAMKILYDSFKYSPPNAVVCYKLANIYLKENNIKFAVFWYKSALICEKNAKSGEFIENDYYDFLPLLQLSYCYYKLGNHAEFVRYHNMAKSIKPYDKAILNNDKFV